jgi:hypothetical protein
VEAVGITNLSASWTVRSLTGKRAAAQLDRYVPLRGSIAHRGSALKSVYKKDVTEYYELVKALVGKTGGRVNVFVRRSTGTRLW